VAGLINYTSTLPGSADIVVVGGGVVGAATAFYARRAGLSPLLLERRSALCTLTTPASTGAFRLQFDNREELELVRESVGVFLNFEETTEQADYGLGIRQQGYLWVTTDEARAERQRALVERQHSWGQSDIEILDRSDVRARWPYLAPEVVQARWRAEDGFLDPKGLTMGFVAGSRARVLVDCTVTGFDVKESRLKGVVTTSGTVATNAAVVAAGPFSGTIAARSGIDVPLVTLQRQKVVVPECELVPQDAPMIIDDDTGAHWRPALRGAYCLFTDPSTLPTPPTEDVPPDHGRALGVLDPTSPTSVARVAPFWRDVWERNSTTWLIHAGQYTMTPDHRPLLGETDIEGLWMNTGYSGHGIMGSPAGSRHLIDVLTGTIAPDYNPFSVDRTFELRDLDLL
jgi:sarcosine oxidase, subunit beta